MPVTLKEFESVFPSLVEEISNHVGQTGLPKSNLEWLVKVLPLNNRSLQTQAKDLVELEL